MLIYVLLSAKAEMMICHLLVYASRRMCAPSVYRVSLGAVLQNLIPEVILSQKCYINMGLIHSGYGVMSIGPICDKTFLTQSYPWN
jgi:energy-converting hydrogenase Eha subunit B